MVVICVAISLSFLSIGNTHAQTSPADTAFLQVSVKQALAAYEEAVGVQTHLYNGTEYVDHKKPHLEGDQFFVSKAVARGEIFYDGTWYAQVPLLYDLVTDEVIVPHNSSGLMMKLVTSKIDTFQLHGHTYLHLRADSAVHIAPEPGFYDLRHNQDVQFLVRRTKQVQDRATQAGMEGEFRAVDKYYIRKENRYHQVSSKRSVYKVFKDKKRQLQKYAAAQRLKFRKQKEESILALVQYYDSLADEQAQQHSH
ncbi:hypothetical protein [Pontibacter brevis]